MQLTKSVVLPGREGMHLAVPDARRQSPGSQELKWTGFTVPPAPGTPLSPPSAMVQFARGNPERTGFSHCGGAVPMNAPAEKPRMCRRPVGQGAQFRLSKGLRVESVASLRRVQVPKERTMTRQSSRSDGSAKRSLNHAGKITRWQKGSAKT